MRFFAIVTVALCVALELAVAAPSDKVDCSKIDEVLDDLGAAQGLTTMNDKYKLFTTIDEFAKRCQQMSDAIKTLRKYNKECFSSLTQQVFSAILRTRSQMNEEHCKLDTPVAKETVEASKCLSDNSLEQVKEAEKKTIISSQILFEANIPDDKLRMRRSCCGVVAGKGYFMDATKEKCSKYEKIYSDYVDSYTSEALGLICPDIKDLKCSELEPLKTDKAELKSTFFLNPMLKLVKTLDH